MHVCMYACMDVCMYVCMDTLIRIFLVFMFMFTYTHACMHPCTHTHRVCTPRSEQHQLFGLSGRNPFSNTRQCLATFRAFNAVRRSATLAVLSIPGLNDRFFLPLSCADALNV